MKEMAYPWLYSKCHLSFKSTHSCPITKNKSFGKKKVHINSFVSPPPPNFHQDPVPYIKMSHLHKKKKQTNFWISSAFVKYICSGSLGWKWQGENNLGKDRVQNRERRNVSFGTQLILSYFVWLYCTLSFYVHLVSDFSVF